MARRVVIGVGLAHHPWQAAGHAWAFLQWVLGFRAAGWEVWMVEDLPSAKCRDAQGQACAFPESENRAHWRRVVEEFSLQDRATLFLDGVSTQSRELLTFARESEFLLNLSGHFRQREVMAAVPLRVYADLDPAFTQIWAEVYGVDLGLDAHERFVSLGLNLGRSTCQAPLAGRSWLPLGVPVCLDYFPATFPPGATWTTLTHWYGYEPVEYRGEWYGNKGDEFARFLHLPGRTAEKLEIASDLHPDDPAHPLFRQAGWSTISAAPFHAPWTRYRAYLAGSRGEFSAAKNGYVRSRCGWFSDRSACYLALGRPVLLQETGWSEHYPAGEGLLTFHDLTTAQAALAEVARAPLQHARAARALAEKYFAAPVVVNQLLETLGRKKGEDSRTGQ